MPRQAAIDLIANSVSKETCRLLAFTSAAYEWAHSAQRVEAGLAVCGTHYLVGDSASGPFTLESRAFFSGDPRGELYAGRVVRTRAGEHVFLAFLQFVDGGPFVGGLSDPFPIIADASGRLSIERGGDWSRLVAPALSAARSA
jgi:hypothetical protein